MNFGPKSLFLSLPQKLPHKLHLVQNPASCIITRTPTSDHITVQNIQTSCSFLCAFQVIHSLSPKHLPDLLQIVTSVLFHGHLFTIHHIVASVCISTMISLPSDVQKHQLQMYSQI